MAPNAFDNTSRAPSEIQTPSTQPLDLNRLSGGERNIQSLCATMSMMENKSTSSMHMFPDLLIYDHDDCKSPQPSGDTKTPTTPIDSTVPKAPTDTKPCTDANGNPSDASLPKPTGDTPAAQGDQSWKSHLNDQWVKDSLKDHPDWHAMEGLHPGEVAVGNWEPTKEEKKMIGSAVDKMLAENNNGPVYINLPDGSLCKIEIIKGGHGQSFSKDNDKPEVNGKKPRKITFGRPAPTDESPEVCGDESDVAANPMDQTKAC
ncbi:MAG: hypothetical protein JST89_12940 [Cyanobacteria bacterium SZAS-4]|nr:hypothetical protein [Cyanobacteria bacterium SZAS-4]